MEKTNSLFDQLKTLEEFKGASNEEISLRVIAVFNLGYFIKNPVTEYEVFTIKTNSLMY